MQTINRNNYEEFFLLYIDHELDAETRLAVENFVEQNADLQIELQMLMQTKFMPDDVLFDDKEILLRTEGNSINEHNYEEYFLLYIDNELSVAKKSEVEKYVLQHPDLQDEFTTLKQAVLTPEIISYGNKEDLYRTEKRRVISLRTWRLSAAAIFVGVCALGVWMWQQNSTHVEVADVKPTKVQPKENVATTKPVDSIHQTIQEQQSTIAQQKDNKEEKIEPQVPSIKKEKKNNDAIAVAKKKDEPVKNDVAVNTSDEPIKNQKTVITHNNVVNNPKEPPANIDNIAQVPDNIQNRKNDVASLQTGSDNQQPSNDYKISPVAYKEINTNDEDNSLHVGMLDLNKTKVKNLFKKAGRMFNKKNNDSDDGKLQVANFEINTKQQ